MKRLLFFIVLLISLGASAQVPGYTKFFSRNIWIAGGFDSTVTVPAGATPAIRGGGWQRAGAIFVDSSNHRLYFWSGGSWRYSLSGTTGGLFRFGVTSEDVTATQNRAFDLGANTFRISGTDATAFMKLDMSTDFEGGVHLFSRGLLYEGENGAHLVVSDQDGAILRHNSTTATETISEAVAVSTGLEFMVRSTALGGTDHLSKINLTKNDIIYRPFLGVMKIDTLQKVQAAADSMMTWNPATTNWSYRAIPQGISGSGAANRSTYWDGAGSITSDDSYLWDATNNRLALNQTANGNGVINITKDNTDFTNTAGAGTILHVNNPNASGQIVMRFDVNGSLAAKTRFDNAGNLSWISAATANDRGHYFFTGGDFPSGEANMKITPAGVVVSDGNITASTPAYAMDVQGTFGVTGAATFLSTGAFTGAVTVADAAFGSGWNGSAQVPTKNAIYDIRPYKEWVAVIDQTGTGDPTATVLQNELGGTIVLDRPSAGTFTLTLSNAFTTSKTHIMLTRGSDVVVGGNASLSGYVSSGDDEITIIQQKSDGTLIDELNQTSIIIRVYY
jgi:hypothetical protein